jgi:hypothetical protein
VGGPAAWREGDGVAHMPEASRGGEKATGGLRAARGGGATIPREGETGGEAKRRRRR